MRPHTDPVRPRLAIVGVGGAGVATLAWLAEAGGIEARLVAVDACPASLRGVPDDGGPAWRPAAPIRIALPRPSGGPASADAMADAARDVGEELRAAVDGADIVLLVVGLSGDTGGGAGPIVAQLARKGGALVLGFGLAPFPFEPQRHHRVAAVSESRLLAACDAVVTLDGDLALAAVGADLPLEWAAAAAREVVRRTALGIAAFVDAGGSLEIGRADLARLLQCGGRSCVAIGTAASHGADAGTPSPTSFDALGPAERALIAALDGPFTDLGAVAAADRVLCQITGGSDLTLADVDAAVERLHGVIRPGCDLRIGVLADVLLSGTARVLLVGTAVPECDAGNVVPFRPAPDPAQTDSPEARLGLARERPVRAAAAG